MYINVYHCTFCLNLDTEILCQSNVVWLLANLKPYYSKIYYKYLIIINNKNYRSHFKLIHDRISKEPPGYMSLRQQTNNTIKKHTKKIRYVRVHRLVNISLNKNYSYCHHKNHLSTIWVLDSTKFSWFHVLKRREMY